MDLDLRRLRSGEVIAVGSAVLLLVFLLVLPWYGLDAPYSQPFERLGISTTTNGWNGLQHLRWLVLVTIVAALALGWFQAARKTPAIPVTLSVIVTVLGTLTTIALTYRVLIAQPEAGPHEGVRIGAYLGLLSAAGIAVGGFLSMRKEGIADRDAPPDIPTVRLET